MIKIIYILLFLLGTSILDIYSQESAGVIINSEYAKCENETVLTTLDNERSRCNDSTILVVLKDEPVLIHRGCLFESDLFYFVLINEPKINHYVSKWIYPCEKIPENFQIDGLSVLVSGNILRCGKGNPCFPSKPNIRVAPTNMFELKSIKLTNVHDIF